MHWCVIYVPTLIRRRTGAAGFVVTTGREFIGLWPRFSNGPGAYAVAWKNQVPMKRWTSLIPVSKWKWTAKMLSRLLLRQRKESIALCVWTAGRSIASCYRRPMQLLLYTVHDFLEVNRLSNEGKTPDPSLVGSDSFCLDQCR